jgi:carbon-monoxide dehydrogenase large subunit
MAQFGLAQPVRRVEDPRLLRGEGAYTDDISLPGTLFGVVVRSPHAAARILAVDPSAAATPGVVAIYTFADLEADGIGPLPCAVRLTNRDGSKQVSPPTSATRSPSWWRSTRRQRATGRKR